VRLTVLGTGTARPVPDTAASGILIESGSTAVLFDCGSGIASQLQGRVSAENLTALVVGHFHADHWIDLAPLRYRFPWGERAPRRLPVHLPPGGPAKLENLAAAMAERPGFFDDAFEVREYSSGEWLEAGDLRFRPIPVGHYVPAWSMDIVGPDGARIVYAGDMGPTDDIVELARGADLLILEATLESSAFDDLKRGHLTTEEAIDHAVRAGVPRALLVHYPSERRPDISARCAASGAPVAPAYVGQVVEVSRVGTAGVGGSRAAATPSS
jgi:ribonuclease BN (tRNA processing enzyme)